jgi:hypothetical protein
MARNEKWNLMNDIQALFLEEDDEQGLLHCPYCGFEYVRVNKPLSFSGGDSYDAAQVFGLGVRGDVDALLFEGECGHQWALAFGFHKGRTYYTLVRRSEEEDKSQ